LTGWRAAQSERIELKSAARRFKSCYWLFLDSRCEYYKRMKAFSKAFWAWDAIGDVLL